MLEAGVLDTYLGKFWGIKLATNAAITVLRVDQVSWRKELLVLQVLHSINQLCRLARLLSWECIQNFLLGSSAVDG